jgi:predicted kinase
MDSNINNASMINFSDTGNFIMLCGIPGSGKTTFARQFVEEHDNWIRIAPDDIRKSVTGDPMNMSRDNEVFSIVYDTIREELEGGSNVIYDATNCNGRYRKNIAKFVASIDNVDLIACFIMSTPLWDCFNNNANRNDDRIVSNEVIENMYTNFRMHAPSIQEGFDIIVQI